MIFRINCEWYYVKNEYWDTCLYDNLKLSFFMYYVIQIPNLVQNKGTYS